MEIKEIKSRLSILDVLNHYGLKTDRNNMLCCPFHDDKTPSMQVYPETNTVFCFSSNCKLQGKAIDQIDFILHKENCTKHEAILKAQSMITETTAAPPPDYNKLFKDFQTSFKRSEKAKTYLEKRHINSQAIEVGYNGNSWAQLKDCVIFPLKDKEDKIVSLYGRTINEKAFNKHYYLKERKGLYPRWPKFHTKILLLTESVIDAATLWQWQYSEYTVLPKDTNLLACYGTNGFTPDHEQAIRELKQLEEVIIFFDGDEAGREGTKRLIEKLQTIFTGKISIVNCPEGEDVNSLVQSHEKEILTHLIDQRQILFSSNEEKTTQTTSSLVTGKLNTKNPEYIIYTYENLSLHIVGGIALYPIDKLKITLKIEIKESTNPLHSIRQSNLDLYSDEQLQKFIRSASERLEVGSKEMHLAIASLISELEQYRQSKIEEQKPKIEPVKTLTESRKQELLKILKEKNLFGKLNELIGQTGVVGEEKNRLIAWTVFTSRLMSTPLHIICLGASGTGKTYLQEKISELIPKQHKVNITASTENALYYIGKTEYKHKLLIIEDLDGVSSTLLTLRELQSKAYVSKLVPVKDSKGNMKTIQLEVEGPICLSGTTTKEKLYEDNANRCLLIYLDNSDQQQQNIMQYQRKLHAGTINKAQEENAKELLQDMQLMFKNVTVVNPYAEKLTIPETVFKPLRSNAHYLQFIEAITFVHQFQRPVKKNEQGQAYIETTLEDIELANELLKDVLLAKSDELTKACRDFLELIKRKLVELKQTSFLKSHIREWTRINPSNVKYYLKTLHFYGYIKSIGGNKYKGGYEYEITSRDEYNRLEASVHNALHQALTSLTNRVSG